MCNSFSEFGYLVRAVALLLCDRGDEGSLLGGPLIVLPFSGTGILCAPNAASRYELIKLAGKKIGVI